MTSEFSVSVSVVLFSSSAWEDVVWSISPTNNSFEPVAFVVRRVIFVIPLEDKFATIFQLLSLFRVNL